MSSDKVETVLNHFAPAPLAIDRDRLMFLAGRADALAEASSSNPERVSLAWPWLTLLSTAAALVMAVLLWQKPSERMIVVERPVTEKTPDASEREARPVPPHWQPSTVSAPKFAARSLNPASWNATKANYVLWRERILREGVEALAQVEPSSTGDISEPATQRELLQEFYGPRATQQPDSPSRNEWWNQWLHSGDQS